ncbi:hypothetical protein OG2516_18690 [Oceanicola granulosus HTCC2516]|uniref:Glycosyltransferase n=2 Tax=Oceanicola granulosus TaxID=252302 RepID=Q2CHB8_OCEGH|nr:hypothetical protein OG2516_18690 [Oceanicola granulosus HTCC2516]
MGKFLRRPPESPSTHEGWVGLFPGHRLKGWLRDTSAPGRSLRVQVRIDSYVSPPLLANEKRPHLAAKGIGNVAHGFSLTLPETVPAQPRQRIELLDLSGTILLSPSLQAPEGTIAPAEPQAVPLHLPRKAYEGWFGLYSSRRVSGWCMVRDDPALKISVRVRVGDYLSDPITANEPREHLEERQCGDGRYGFSLHLPGHLMLAPDTVIEILLAESLLPIQRQSCRKFEAAFNSLPRKSSSGARRARTRRDNQAEVMLLWCPISVSGLTTQLQQVTAILRRHQIAYQISYHTAPTVDAHPELDHWIDPADIDSPKMVFYFERFVPFDRGFEGAFKVFYVNLDWLSDSIIPLVRTYADLVLAPVPYRLDDLRRMFCGQHVEHLPWPPAFAPDHEAAPRTGEAEDKIRVLYIGNDYDEMSRKSPVAVVEAMLACDRTDLVFDLKFRSRLPEEVRARLLAAPQVEKLIDEPTDHAMVRDLHRSADVSLIPNECEGNGLSILEAWALEVVPAVLNGHPMCDVVSETNAFLIECDDLGMREQTKLYRTDARRIGNFLAGLEREDLSRKLVKIREEAPLLLERQNKLERVILDAAHASGLHAKSVRLALREAHQVEPASRRPRIHDLMFGTRSRSTIARSTERIDVMMTTFQRPKLFSRSLEKLVDAMQQSPFEHRLFIAAEELDRETAEILQFYTEHVHQVLWTGQRQGLPYSWNMLGSALQHTIARTEHRPDYVCYIQDDCEILEPSSYFEVMATVANAADPGLLGFVSGYHTDIHPGFATSELEGRQIVFSDSVDGKNFMARPRTLQSIGPLSWWFKDGMRRGNPGPVRGSHFDLWQWQESPNSLKVQRRVNVVLPELTGHSADGAELSTWANDTSPEEVEKRISAGRVYHTR